MTASCRGWRSPAARQIPHHALRLWELAKHAPQDPAAGLTFAARPQVGELDLFDYLFSMSATLREGLMVSSQYRHLLTTNDRDPVLARILREYAAALPPPAPASWQECFRQHPSDAIRHHHCQALEVSGT